MITPDFWMGQRLTSVDALTGHGCITFDRTEGGAGPKTIAILGSRPLFAVAPAQWRGSFLVDYALGVSAALLRSRRNARVGILLIVAGLPGLSTVCALCAARIGHAGADRTDAEPRGDGSFIATCAILFTLPLSPAF